MSVGWISLTNEVMMTCCGVERLRLPVVSVRSASATKICLTRARLKVLERSKASAGSTLGQTDVSTKDWSSIWQCRQARHTPTIDCKARLTR